MYGVVVEGEGEGEGDGDGDDHFKMEMSNLSQNENADDKHEGLSEPADEDGEDDDME